MEIILDKNEFTWRREIFSAAASREEMTDYVVPDALPDIARIVNVCGGARIRGKRVENGTVTVETAVAVTAVYVAEGEQQALRCLETEVEVPVSASVPDANETTDVVASLSVDELEVRMLNPRKILVRACVSAAIRCFNEEKMSIASGISSGGDLQVLTRSCTAAPVTDVREKTFTISDEIAMPPSVQGYSHIMCTHTSLKVTDVKFVGNKLIFKGAAVSDILAQPAGAALPVSFGATSEFSQILELGAPCDCAEVLLCLTGAYFNITESDGGKSGVSAELHILAQAVAGLSREISCISDAYSNRVPCTVRTESMELPQCPVTSTLPDTFRTLIELPEAAAEVICAGTSFSAPEIRGGQLTSRASVRCMYIDGARQVQLAQTVDDFTIDAPLPENVCGAVINTGEIYAAPSVGGIEVRVTVDADVRSCPMCRLECVTAIEEDAGAARPERPSVYIIPRRDGADLWGIAKKYGSTEELIRSAACDGGNIMLIPVQH